LAWVDGYVGSLPARRQSPIPVLTGLNVEQLRWSRPTRYRYTKPPNRLGLLPRQLEIACIDPHQTGFVGKGSDLLQLIKFWPSRPTPQEGSLRRCEIFGSALLQRVPSVCVSSERFFIVITMIQMQTATGRRGCREIIFWLVRSRQISRGAVSCETQTHTHTHRQTDRTDYNTLRRSFASAQCNNRSVNPRHAAGNKEPMRGGPPTTKKFPSVMGHHTQTVAFTRRQTATNCQI